MGRIWEDGFDHYGTNIARMLDGDAYANASSGSPNDQGLSFSSTRVATGTRSLFMGAGAGLTTYGGLRRIVYSPTNKLGMQLRAYWPGLPSHNYSACICHMCTSDVGTTHLSWFVDANACIRVVRGGGTIGTGPSSNGTLIYTSDPILTANAWNHIEIQAYIHDTDGWIRCAINGIHKFEVTGLDTKAATSDLIYSIGQNHPYTAMSGPYYMEDYILYDFTGDPAVDTDYVPSYDVGTGKATAYIGDLQVWPLFPNGDTAEADFLKSTGADGYALIDENSPDDTDYIYSTVENDLSEFAVEDLPPEITYIRGLTIVGRWSKADAGAALIRQGMRSAAATTDAPERPITVEPSYWRDMINKDPDSDARWTRASLNAAWLRLLRTV